MLGALIGAGASLLGGLFGQSSQKKQMQMQIDQQREFAQHGVRWKVEDAKAAGIHPLYALGAQTVPFSPIGIGGSPLADGISQAGQSIGRAIDAKGTIQERTFNTQMMALQLQRGQLENQLLASQISRINSPTQMPPPMPSRRDPYLIEGQAQSAPTSVGPIPRLSIESVPMEQTVSAPGVPNIEPGAINDQGFARTATGWAPVMSSDVKQRLEEDIVGELLWTIRNRLAPTITTKWGTPPAANPGAGNRWVYNPLLQEYQIQRDPYYRR